MALQKKIVAMNFLLVLNNKLCDTESVIVAIRKDMPLKSNACSIDYTMNEIILG